MDQPGQEPSGGGVSRLAALCGRPDGPALTPPPGLLGEVSRLADSLQRRSSDLGRRVAVDPVGLVVERAERNRFVRQGDISCGGSARLVRSGDGWMAVNLARREDWDLVDAWLQPATPIPRGRWADVTAELGRHSTGELLSRSSLLGLPVAALGERHGSGSGVRLERLGSDPPPRQESDPPPRRIDDLLVLDLSSLWAGPLAAGLLQRAGARVVKVESWSRPDGARDGPPHFFNSLNRDKASVALDFDTPLGRARLHALVERADVVITAARPRALQQLGLASRGGGDPGPGPQVRLSITGYGTAGASADRVAFGDDAAVAGGLVVWDDRGPCFCGDAVADPVSGLAGAVAVLAALERGGRWLIDVSMADVAAACLREGPLPDGPAPVGTSVDPGGPAVDPVGTSVDPGGPAVDPVGPAVDPGGPAAGVGAQVAELGADTASILSELGIR
jgi:hypothetical protein